ncbi:MAG: glycosyltransferase [Solirubrobacteraceae bacterium]|nr:glycosyltransferase [Solirubrobacteraceae bacterium]
MPDAERATYREGELPSYAIVSPVRDEADGLPRTAASLLAQTHRPAQWVLVDDGSTDGTLAIAQALAAQHDWISVVRTDGVHRRSRGAAIVRAFDTGRARLTVRPEVTVKLDCDLFVPAHYFAWVCATFARDPAAGVVGGVMLVPGGGGWRPDGAPHHVGGPMKAYRTRCLDDIGGLRASMGWDGVDEYAATARGWRVHVLTELSVLHYKPRGSKQPWYQARWEEGRGNAYMGYLPSFLLLRAMFRMAFESPPLVGGLVLAAGFVHARLSGAAQVDDELAVAALRAEQRARMRALLRGRRHVVAGGLPAGGPAFWFPADPPGPKEPAP